MRIGMSQCKTVTLASVHEESNNLISSMQQNAMPDARTIDLHGANMDSVHA